MAGKYSLLNKSTEKSTASLYGPGGQPYNEYRGAWSGTTGYTPGDLVLLNNKLYVAKNKISAPGSTGISSVGNFSNGGNANCYTSVTNVTLPTGSAASDLVLIAVTYATENSSSGLTSTSSLIDPSYVTSTLYKVAQSLGGNANYPGVIALYTYYLTASDIAAGKLVIPIQNANTGFNGGFLTAIVYDLKVAGITSPVDSLPATTMPSKGSNPVAVTTSSVASSTAPYAFYFWHELGNGETALAASPTLTGFDFNNTGAGAGVNWGNCAIGYLNLGSSSTSIPAVTFTPTGATGQTQYTATAVYTFPSSGANVFNTADWTEVAAVHDATAGTLQASDPVNSTDVATKNYVDTNAIGHQPTNNVQQTASFTATTGINLINTTSALTVTLPASPGLGAVVTLVRIDTTPTAVVTIAAGTGDTMSAGQTTFLSGSISYYYRSSTKVWYPAWQNPYYGTTTPPAGSTSASTASAVVQRDSNSRAQFADPAAAQDAATKNYVDTRAVGAGGLLVPVGYCVPPANYTGNQANGTPPSGSQTFVPVDILSGGTYNTIKTSVTTAAVGGTITCTYAVYKDDGTGTLPNLSTGLLTNQGPSTVTSVGMKTPSIGTTVLTAGRYWLSCFYYTSVAPTTSPVWDTMGGSGPVAFLDPTSQASWEINGPRALRLTGLTAVATTTQAASAYTLVSDVTVPLMGLYRSA